MTLALLLVSCLSADVKDYDPLTLPNLRVLGRTGSDAINLYWTGSGVEMDLYGSELWIEVDVDWSYYEPWISALEKEQLLVRMPLQRGRQWILLFRGFDASKSHHITILRETQAMSDTATSIKLTGLRFDGELKPLPTPKIRIEYIGDSHTSAEGALGVPEDTEWIPLWFTAARGYPTVSARELGAEPRIISQSGWGCLSSYDNNPNHALPKVYEYICSVNKEGKGSNMNPNDFKAWQPDLVLVALGANDRSSWSASEWTGNGETFKNSPELFEEAAYKFLERLRELNAGAYLAWMFPQEDPMSAILDRVTEKFRKEHDQKCQYFVIPAWEKTGVRGHSNWEFQAEQAKVVATHIAEMLGLDYEG